MPADNDASNYAIKVESVSIDTKRVQTEDPHIVGTLWNARVEQTNIEIVLSPSQKLEEKRETP